MDVVSDQLSASMLGRFQGSNIDHIPCLPVLLCVTGVQILN